MKGREAYPDEELRRRIMDFIMAAAAGDPGVGLLVAGIGICIEKGFQPGGAELRAAGYKLASLAIVNEMSDDHLTFREQ